MLNKIKYLFFATILLTFVGENNNPRIRGPDMMVVNRDVRDIARVICTESFLYCPRDMFLIGSTIINRTHSQDFPSSIREVTRQSGQYQGFYTSRKRYMSDPVCNTVAVFVYWRGGINDKVLYFSNISKSTDRKHKNKLQAQTPQACSPYHCFWGDI